MKQMRKRLTALLLVLAMVCSFMVTASAGDNWWEAYVTSPLEDWSIDGVQDGKVESTGNYVLFTSDVHRYAYLVKDLLGAANTMIAQDGG